MSVVDIKLCVIMNVIIILIWLANKPSKCDLNLGLGVCMIIIIVVVIVRCIFTLER